MLSKTSKQLLRLIVATVPARKMTAVRPSTKWDDSRKPARPRLNQQADSKVAVVPVDDGTDGVIELQCNRDSVDAGFCENPYADKGELLASLSPLLFSMKLFGLYFERGDRIHRRRADDPECDPTTPTARTSSTRLRVYATVVLIAAWLNALRSFTAFTSRDKIGTTLFMKIAVVLWFGLTVILQTAYYYASHTGQLSKVLLTLPVTPDCVHSTHRVAIGLLVCIYTTLVANAIVSACLFYVTNGEYDFNLAPLVTYIEVPDNLIYFARFAALLLYYIPIPMSLFSQVMTQVLVYIFYTQFRKLKKDFRRALKNYGGDFASELSLFRRRHQTLTRAVSKVDIIFIIIVNILWNQLKVVELPRHATGLREL